MRFIFIEGQPGSGKSGFSELILRELGGETKNNVYIDEYTQDSEIFGDFWEVCNDSYEYALEKFKNAWSVFLNQYCKPGTTYILDNSLMNHVQYLMALSAPREAVCDFVKYVANIFSGIKTSMIFLDGDSEIIINRIDGIRKNGWGERVAELFAKFPYQKERHRSGKDGMVKFFSDSQSLKRETLNHWTFPLLKIDITNWEWDSYNQRILDFIRSK
jgi:thymidylate kinase